jgi:hypothetical protein
MELNFESMKRVLTEPIVDEKEKKVEKQKETVRQFREKNFDDLVKHTETKVIFYKLEFPLGFLNQFPIIALQHDLIQNKLNELFNSLSTWENRGMQVDGYVSPTLKNQTQQKKIYENHFPELFFY